MMYHGVETRMTAVGGAGCCSRRLWLLGSGSGAAAAAHYWWTAGWQPCALYKEEFWNGWWWWVGRSVLDADRSIPQPSSKAKPNKVRYVTLFGLSEQK